MVELERISGWIGFRQRIHHYLHWRFGATKRRNVMYWQSTQQSSMNLKQFVCANVVLMRLLDVRMISLIVGDQNE